MPNRAILIDRCELQPIKRGDPRVFVQSWSNGQALEATAMRRSTLREYLEFAIRDLDAADIRERSEVVPFKGRGGRHSSRLASAGDNG